MLKSERPTSEIVLSCGDGPYDQIWLDSTADGALFLYGFEPAGALSEWTPKTRPTVWYGMFNTPKDAVDAALGHRHRLLLGLTQQAS